MFHLTSSSSDKKSYFWKKVSSVLSKLHSKRPRTFWWIFFSKSFFFNLVSSLSEDFSSFVKKFSTKLSKLNFTCPVKHFDQNIMLTLWNNIRLWARKCLICGRKFAALLSIILFCLQMGNWKNSFERNFTFSDLIFLGPPGNFFWFFRWVILQMVVKTAFFMPWRTYAMGKTFWQNFFLSFSDYEGYFLKLPLIYLMLGCQKYNLRVQRITLRKVMFFWEFFKFVFGLWAIIVQTSGENFQQRCRNCIPCCQRTSRFSLQ